MPRQGLCLRGRPRCWQWTLSPITFPLPGAHTGQATDLWSCDEQQPPTEWPLDAQALPSSQHMAHRPAEREQPMPPVSGSVLILGDSRQSEQNATPSLPIVCYVTGVICGPGKTSPAFYRQGPDRSWAFRNY